MKNKKAQSVQSKKSEPVEKKVYVKNITNQKQVVEIFGESFVLSPYEEKPVTHTVQEMQKELNPFIRKTILEILTK